MWLRMAHARLDLNRHEGKNKPQRSRLLSAASRFARFAHFGDARPQKRNLGLAEGRPWKTPWKTPVPSCPVVKTPQDGPSNKNKSKEGKKASHSHSYSSSKRTQAQHSPRLISFPRRPSHTLSPNPTTGKPGRHHATLQQLQEEEQERQRRYESNRRIFRLASEETVLGLLESPPPPWTQGDVAIGVLAVGRGGLVLRALERGVLSPDTPCGRLGTLVHVAARWSC